MPLQTRCGLDFAPEVPSLSYSTSPTLVSRVPRAVARMSFDLIKTFSPIDQKSQLLYELWQVLLYLLYAKLEDGYRKGRQKRMEYKLLTSRLADTKCPAYFYPCIYGVTPSSVSRRGLIKQRHHWPWDLSLILIIKHCSLERIYLYP